MYVIFDEPVELSMVRIWNYRKTPGRGVRDIAVCISSLRLRDVVSVTLLYVFLL